MTYLFPPVLDKTIPAFVGDTLTFEYTLSSVGEWPNALEYRVLNSKDNSVFATGQTEDKPVSPKGSITVTQPEDKSWQTGNLYKVQIRSCYGSDNVNVSEWSNTAITKRIETPTITLNDNEKVNNTSTTLVVATESPVFTGTCVFSDKTKEKTDKYMFTLKNSSDQIIEQSEWITHIDNVDKYMFKTHLANKKRYKVEYSIVSINGYTNSASINVSVAIGYLDSPKDILLQAEPMQEDACNYIYLTCEKPLIGNYVIVRSDAKSNYTIWEDIKYLFYTEDILYGQLIFKDLVIESGMGYKYSIQAIDNAGNRTALLGNESICVNYFEHMYLVADGLQLKIKYNNKVSSFKHSVLETKNNTLGSKYPTIMRNGYAYYAEFPIGGLITLHMDDNNFFFEKKYVNDKVEYYYKDQLIIPAMDELNYNSSAENIFAERKFREKVEEFLNNGEYKLLKSPTEGNFIVSLMSINLQPNQTLGRMIAEFSASAIEMADNTFDNLKEFNIIDPGSITSFDNNNAPWEKNVGQVTGTSELLKEMKNNEQTLGADSEYEYEVEFVSGTIEQAYGEAAKTITVTINDNNIQLQPNQVFYLTEDMEITSISSSDKITLTYVCKKRLIPKKINAVKTLSSSVYIGQLNGTIEPYENILEAIGEQHARQYLTSITSVEGLIYRGENTATQIYYNADFYLSDIEWIEIEAEPGTTFVVNQDISKDTSILLTEKNVLYYDGETATQEIDDHTLVLTPGDDTLTQDCVITLGPTGVYRLKPSAQMINSIEFIDSSWALINFKSSGLLIKYDSKEESK